MKLYNYEFEAARDFDKENKIYLNRKCPFSPRDCLCGNWCALFNDFTNENGNTFVVMGCKANHEDVEVLPNFEKE